jgi:hypothetical protein
VHTSVLVKIHSVSQGLEVTDTSVQGTTGGDARNWRIRVVTCPQAVSWLLAAEARVWTRVGFVVKWHWDRLFSEFFSFLLSASFQRGSSYSYIVIGQLVAAVRRHSLTPSIHEQQQQPGKASVSWWMFSLSFPVGPAEGKCLQQQATHHRKLQRQHPPGCCSNSCRRVAVFIVQFGSQRPLVHGHGKQPLSAPCVTRCSFTRTDVCTFSIWSPSVRK